MLDKLLNLIRRPFCVHVFHRSRSRPGWIVCQKCRLYRRD